MPDALVIIDMQVGSFGPTCPPRYDQGALFERLKALANWVRENRGVVIWVHHDGPSGDVLEPGTEGWQILPALEPRTDDETVRKTACDAFLGTRLEILLKTRRYGRVIVTGWATDFCVDTTVRSCTARGFKTWAPADGHTLEDRPHLPAVKVIEHHNYIWSDLIAPGGPVRIATCEQLMSGSTQ